MHRFDPRNILTVLRWLPQYDRTAFRGDLAAGLTTGIVLIPQSMAYAILAGVPAIFGLYASLVPLAVYALLGTSRHLAVGVVAIDMLIVHAGLSDLGHTAGSAEYIQLAVVLALMVGAVQLVMGITRLGFVANLLSRPVMVGFTSGAAVLIALSQVAGLAGMEIGPATVLPTLVSELAGHVGEVRLLPLAFGATAIAAILLLRKAAPRIPAALVVVALGTLIVAALGLNEGALPVVGSVPQGFPEYATPAIDAATIESLLPTALALALIQFLSVASLGKVFAARSRTSVQPNRELTAIGVANMTGSFFQGLPVSGSFSRTALNEQTGSRTPLVNLVAAAVVGGSLLVLTPALALVPVAVLSAIVVVAALGLLDIEEMRFLLRAKTTDGRIAMLTFVATAVLGILEGIFVGVGASLLALLYRMSRPNAAVLGHLPGTRSFRDLRHSDAAQSVDGILMLRIDASFSFMNAEFLKEVILDRTSRDSDEVRAVVVDASSINDLDTTAAEVLIDVKRTLDERGIDLFFGGVKESVQGVLERMGFIDTLGRESFFLSPHRAVTHVLEERGDSASYLRNVPGALDAE